MKRDCPGHPKTLRLRRLLNEAALRHYGASNMFVPNAGTGDLIRRRDVLGILEALWLSTTQHAPDGDLSRWDPADTAEAVDWDGPPEALIQALLDCGGAGHAGFLDRLPDGRLVVHDWAEHCQDSVHLTLARAHRRFCDGSLPKLSRLGKVDRETISDWYDQHPVGASTTQPTPIEAPAPTTTAPTTPVETPTKTPTPTTEAPTPSVQTHPKRIPCARHAHTTTAEAPAVRTTITLPLPSPSHPITLPSHHPPLPQPQQQPDAAHETAPRAEPAAAAAASQKTLTATELQDETAGQTRYGSIVVTTPLPAPPDPPAVPEASPPPPPLRHAFGTYRFLRPDGDEVLQWPLDQEQVDAWIAEFASRRIDVRGTLHAIRLRWSKHPETVRDPTAYLHGALLSALEANEARAAVRDERLAASAPNAPAPAQTPTPPAQVDRPFPPGLWEAARERLPESFHDALPPPLQPLGVIGQGESARFILETPHSWDANRLRQQFCFSQAGPLVELLRAMRLADPHQVHADATIDVWAAPAAEDLDDALPEAAK